MKRRSSELPAPLLYYVFKSLQKDTFKLANVFSYEIPQRFHIFCHINLCQNRKRGFLKSSSRELPAPLLYYVFKSLQKEIFKLANVFLYQIPPKFHTFCHINLCQNRKRGFLKSSSSELPAPLLYYVFKSLQKDIFKLAKVFSYQMPQKSHIFAT